MEKQSGPQEIGCVISAAIMKIGKNDLNGAIGRLELAIRMIRALAKQKSGG
jgi:hypothetical protein